MADHNERWVLNRLIEMCRDEEQSLRYLADHVKDPVMKTLLGGLAARRAAFAADLVPHAQRLGGFEPHDGTTRGAWQRRWRALRDSLVRQDDRARIAEAEQGEQRVLAMYGGALDQILPPGTRDLVEHQAAEVRRAHGEVRALLH
jgi:uncharacterized protein (TIGR02284 family)